jgi:hypothetical protein
VRILTGTDEIPAAAVADSRQIRLGEFPPRAA